MKITRTRGDTYADQFLITDRTGGKAANISNCSFKMSVSGSMAPDSATQTIYTLTGVVSDPTSGIVSFAPTAAQANLVGSYFFDVQMTDSNGAIRTLVLDSYTYTQDITK